jgi:flagellar hook-basal body protein
MSLASAMSTALTGLNASDTQIGVIGNNLANANTVGFKASDVLFATQFLQTQSVGSSPSGDSGGTNPQQQGLGVEVAEITPNFEQGTISTANSPTDLAIQGDGFFIVQGQNGGQNYTRNGTFTTNANNQLVTGTGNLVMGYGVNADFQVDTSQLVPLSIPLGSASVAKATTEATLQGSLSSKGQIATQASILQTGPLTDGSIPQPASTLTASIVQDPAHPGTNLSGNLSGTYNYYVTFYDSTTDTESRPQAVATSISLTNGQVTLADLPPPVPAAGTWTSERIYRNTNDTPGDTNYYEIADIPIATATANGFTFNDNYADTAIVAGGAGLVPPANCNQVPAGPNILSFNGPPVTGKTLLSNVLEYNATTGAYEYLCPLPAATQADPNPSGTFSFTGTKGGTTLTAQDLTVTDTTTLNDLATFMQGSLGIQAAVDNSTATSEPGPGVSISDGGIKIVGNDGTPNAISVGLSAMQWTPAGSTTTSSVSLPFTSTQSANGEGTTASMTAYDSLGTPLTVNIIAVLVSETSSSTTYRWYADCGQNNTGGAENIAVGTGTVSFDGDGNFQSASNTTVSVEQANYPSKPLQFNLDFSQVSGLATGSASLNVASQDGSAPGVLNSFNISDSGLISGVFSNGISQNLGQLQLARFTNPTGLEQVGQNMYATGVNSGLPIVANPGNSGTGTIVAGSLELSNTDVGGSLINLITSSTAYQANTRVITTATQLFDVLLQLGQVP